MNSFFSLRAYSPPRLRRAARRAVWRWGVHSLPHGKERTKKTCQRALPFGFPWWEALAIDISAPRQKCFSTFFLGCENVLRYRESASGNPKISLLQGFIDVPLLFGKKFFIPTPPFLICEGLVCPCWALLRSPNFVLRSSKIFE